MKRLVVLAVIISTLAACSRKRKEEEHEPSERAVRPGTTLGSASAPLTPPSAPVAPAQPIAGIELANRVDECWTLRNSSTWEQLKACYAPDAVVEVVGSPLPSFTGPDGIITAVKQVKTTFPDEHGEPKLVIVDDKRATAILLHTGTNTGTDPTGTVKGNGKKFGALVVQVYDFDTNSGRIKHVAEYFDLATLSGQLNPSKDHPVRPVLDKAPMAKEAVLMAGTDTERANLATIGKLDDAFAKHDAKAVADLIDDNATWSEQVQPNDWTKKVLVANLPKLWKAAPELETTSDGRWAAGDYVVERESIKLAKTSTAIPALVVYKLAAGKIVAAWSFFQSPAPTTK